jgi:tetratricopeptide (TPR) repeat protein
VDAASHDSLTGRAEEIPAAAELLALLSAFAPEPVPLSVLADRADLLPPPLDGLFGDDGLEERLRQMQESGLVEVAGEALVVPEAAAAAIQASLENRDRGRWCSVALKLLRDCFPKESDDYRNWEACQELLPHVGVLADQAESLGVGADLALWLLDRAAVFLHSCGQFSAATDLATRAVAGIASLAPDDPLRGTLRRTLGNLLGEYGELDEAKKELEQAIEIHEALPDQELSVREDRVAFAGALWEAGEHEEARRQLDIALAGRAPEDADRCDCEAWRTRAWVLCEEGDLEKSRDAYKDALELLERVQGPEHPDTAEARTGLAVALAGLGRLEDGKAELERALEISEPALGPLHPEIAVIRSNLGGVLHSLGDLRGARSQLELALDAGNETLPADHRGIWIRHRKLAGTLQSLNDLNGAREHAEEALAISERAVGPTDARVEGDLETLASILRQQGDRRKAYEAYERARRIAMRERGADEAATAVYELRLGQLSREFGDFAASRRHLEQALRIYTEMPETQPNAALTRFELARLLADLGEEMARAGGLLGRDEEAEALRGQVSNAFVDTLSSELDTVDLGGLIAMADVAGERAPEIAARALGRAKEKLDEKENQADSSRRRIGVAWHRLGRTRRGLDDASGAMADFEAALDLLAGNPESQGIVLHDMAELRQSQREPSAAIDLFREAVARKREAGESADPRSLAVTLRSLARALRSAPASSDDYEAALGSLTDSLDALRTLPERDRQGEAVILHESGDVQRALGRGKEAIELYRKTLQLKREVDTEEGPRDLGVTLLWLGRSLATAGEYDEALQQYREWLDILRSQAKRDPQAEGVVLHDIADVRIAQGAQEEAIELYREAADCKREGESPRDLAVTLHVFGRTLYRSRAYEEALEVYLEQLEILRSLPEPEPQVEGVALHDIADVRRAKGETAEAIEFYREAVERKREASEPSAIRSLIASLQALGRALEHDERYDEAFNAYNEQLEILRSLPEADPQVEGVALHDIADVRRAKGETAEAIELYREAVERKREAGEPGAHSLSVTLQALGRMLEHNQDFEGALEAYLEELDVARSLSDPESEGTALHDIADVHQGQGKVAQALEFYREAVARRREAVPVNRRRLLIALQALGRALERDGDYEAALAAYEEQLELTRSLAEADPLDEGVALHDIADVRRAKGETAEAIELYREAVERKRESPSTSQRSLSITLQSLGRALESEKEHEAALAAYEEQLELTRSLPEADPLDEGVALHDIADVRRAKGETAEAIELYREAVERKREAGEASAHSLGVTLQALGRAFEHEKRYGEALDAYESQLEVLRSLPELDLHIEGVALHDIAAMLEALGKASQAVASFREAAERKREAVERRQAAGEPANVRSLAVTMQGLGRALERMADFPGARDAYRESLDLIRSLPQRDALAEGLTLNDLANMHQALDETETAVGLFREAAERRREAGDFAPGDVASTLISQGAAELRLADADRDRIAETINSALELLKEDASPDPQMLSAVSMIRGELARGDDDREALRFFLQAAEVLDVAGGYELERVSMRAVIAGAYQALDDAEQAAVQRADAVALLEEHVASGLAGQDADAFTATMLLCIENGAMNAAHRVVEQARARIEEEGSPEGSGPWLSFLLGSFGRALEQRKDYAAALVAYGEQLEVLGAYPEPDPQGEGVVLHDLGDVHWAQGETEKAIELYGKAAERKRSLGEATIPDDLAITLVARAALYLERNETESAGKLGEEALGLLRSVEHPDHDVLASALALSATRAIETGDIDRALELLREADGMAGEPYRLEPAVIKELLVQVYGELGSPDKARAAREEARALQDEEERER